jgi:hypothetical protein
VVGVPVVALYVSGVVWALGLKQTAVADAAFVIVGNALTVIVNVLEILEQPLEFFTVILPVYVPAVALAGIAILMLFADKAALLTATKLFAGVVFQVML